MASQFILSAVRRSTTLLAAGIFAVALLLRVANAPLIFAGGEPQISPIDELYQLKRMTYSAAHFPAVLQFDHDRGVGGAFCPWPPLYDLTAGGVARLLGATTKDQVLKRTIWFAPFAFALFAALAFVWMERRFGRVAALTAAAAIAASPFTITFSWIGSIDHHWLEPIFVVAILAGVLRSVRVSPADDTAGHGGPAVAGEDACATLVLLAIALTSALFVQTALLIAAALAFLVLFLFSEGAEGAIAFGIGAIAIALYRLTRPAGYPDNAWFLGWTHAALFAAAAVALAYKRRGRILALLLGAMVVVATPSAPTALLSGSQFFGGEHWLKTIAEFQPVWTARGEDLLSILVGLGAGSLLVWPLAVRAIRTRDQMRITVALFAIVYLVLTITSRRFWSVGIPLAAIAGAIFSADETSALPRRIMIVAVALIPPIQFALWMTNPLPPVTGAMRSVLRAARFLHTQPPGRVLAPWWTGHALDVAGERPVIIDNFGTMPDEMVFERAYDAFRMTSEESLARYCDESGVRFIVFEPPGALRTAAVLQGLDPGFYANTKLARSTVWWRAFYGNAPLHRFRRVYVTPGIVIVERQ